MYVYEGRLPEMLYPLTTLLPRALHVHVSIRMGATRELDEHPFPAPPRATVGRARATPGGPATPYSPAPHARLAPVSFRDGGFLALGLAGLPAPDAVSLRPVRGPVSTVPPR